MSALEAISTRLVYTEDQALLREEVRRWLGSRSTMENVRRFLEGEPGEDSSLWVELAAQGWLGLATPVEYGGAGLGAVELAIVSEEAGRTLLTAPLLGHLLATQLIVAGGSAEQKATWLPRLAGGDVRAAWAHVEPHGDWRATRTSVVVERGRLVGTKAFVWGAETADVFCVPVRGATGLRVALVPRDSRGVAVVAERTLDRTRRQGRLVLDGVEIADPGLLERSATEIEDALLPLAWAAIAAESVGGASAALDMTASYAATREQFGKPIGSFQAIKHPLVNVLIAIEHARSLVYAAACAIDQETPDAELLGRMAKATSGEAYGFATSRAIQFHGGFGFTEECDAHLYRRRALASRPAFGDPDHHRARIADLVLGPSTP